MRKLEHVNIVKLKYFFYSAGEKVRNSDIYTRGRNIVNAWLSIS